jgi:capsular polysaccharide transport system permease protein
MPTESGRNDRAEGDTPSLLPGRGPIGTADQARPVPEKSGAPEVIRQKTIQVLSERIKLLGVDRSGAYEHYNLQLSSGFPIPPGELAILDLVRRKLPHMRSYHEIGSGLGTLPLMLAYEGLAAVGIERDERRHLTATAILRELSADVPQIESNCRLIGAAFPDAVADLDVSDSIAILTDFVSSQASSDYIRLCRGLAQYRYLLLDLQRFCVKRDSRDEQDRLVEELASYGISPGDEIIDLDSQGYYRLFECRPSFDKRGPALDAGLSDGDGETVPKMEPTVAAAHRQAAQLPVSVPRNDIQLRPSTELAVGESKSDLPATTGVLLPPMPQRVRRKCFGGLLGLSALLVIGIPTLLAIVYFGFIASSQYVTSFQFAVRGPSQSSTTRAGGGAAMGVGAMSPDSFVVTDYINSPQAIADVERDVNLRAIFSRPNVDFWSRLPSNLTAEQLNAYWAHMVSANFDLISGNVSVSVRAFTPQDSLKLAQALVTTSDDMFRRLNAKAQQDFVRLADENVTRAQQQLAEARQALFVFREEGGGLVDPDKAAQAGAAIVDDLRKQLSALQVHYASIKAAAPNSPMLPPLSAQISSLEAQISREDRSGSPRPKSVTPESLAEYQSLDLERQYADKQYTEALALRNQAYLTAQNQQSYLALFAAPTLPQTSLYPNRLRAIAAVVLGAAAAWFAGMLIAYALRDHMM